MSLEPPVGITRRAIQAILKQPEGRVEREPQGEVAEITEEELGLCAATDDEAGGRNTTFFEPKFLKPTPPAESPPWEIILEEQAKADDGPGESPDFSPEDDDDYAMGLDDYSTTNPWICTGGPECASYGHPPLAS